MRGKGVDAYRFYKNRRITPAYAGKSDNKVGEIAEWEDHPRLCGEKDSPLLNSTLILGSPPPMRGKDREPADTGCTDGITPAYAGKSSYTTAAESEENRITPAYAGKSMELSSNIMVSKDHPRLCGEKKNGLSIILWGTGSPPPMRGKGQTSTVFVESEGITPAYAGKSSRIANIRAASEDNPRLCGEKCF